MQDADWHNQPPPPRVAPDPLEEPEPEPEGPKSPSPLDPEWWSYEARRRRAVRFLCCVAAGVVGFLVFMLGLMALVCTVFTPRRWFL